MANAILSPAKEEVARLLKDYRNVPVFHELLMDSFTPIHLFNALHEAFINCFILESVDNKDSWGRYSYIGIQPKQRITLNKGTAVVEELSGEREIIEIKDPAEFFNGLVEKNRSPKIPGRPKLTGGLMGYFSYDMVRYFEKTLTSPPTDDLGLPDAELFNYDKLVAYDHLSNKAIITLNISADGDLDKQYAACEDKVKEVIEILKNYTPKVRGYREDSDTAAEVRSNITKEQYMANVEKAKEYIRAGDIFQVVPSQRFEIDNPPDSFDVYRMLRTTNPSPYLFYFSCLDYAYAGASPEMLISVNGGKIVNRPIAGTIKRGATDAEDLANEKKLLSDPKERAEHMMLVDLGRNDVGKVSKFGSVKVTENMIVERYSKVMHLVSSVEGQLAEGRKPMDALMAVLPAGTLSGAPKVRAMEIIDELETTKRCLYGGTVGYLAYDGSIDTCIAIRTVLFRNGKAYVQAGGGVVLDSDPEKEYEESVNKSMAIVNAVKEAAKL